MTDNVLNFPKDKSITPDAILDEAMGKYKTCIVIGITNDGSADYAICAEDAQEVIFLIRMLEHLVIANELN